MLYHDTFDRRVNSQRGLAHPSSLPCSLLSFPYKERCVATKASAQHQSTMFTENYVEQSSNHGDSVPPYSNPRCSHHNNHIANLRDISLCRNCNMAYDYSDMHYNGTGSYVTIIFTSLLCSSRSSIVNQPHLQMPWEKMHRNKIIMLM